MAERHVSGEPRRHGEREPAEFGARAGDEARGRPQRDMAGLLSRLDPVIEAFHRVDNRIGARHRERRDLGDDRLGWPNRSRRRGDRQALLDPGFERPQFHLIEKRKELLRVVRRYSEIG